MVLRGNGIAAVIAELTPFLMPHAAGAQGLANERTGRDCGAMERREIGAPDEAHSAWACPKSDRASLRSTDPGQSLTFEPLALTAAVARTAIVRDDAPLVVLDALKRSTLPMHEAMIETVQHSPCHPIFCTGPIPSERFSRHA